MATAKYTDDFDITKCSICLEEFTLPKYLPCLHTFCEACLNKHITSTLQRETTKKITEFNCPVCRQKVKPPDVTNQYTKWARQFPLNHLIAALMDKKKLKANVKLCDPCRFNNIDVTAVRWCLDCNDALCEECFTLHKGLKLTRNHNLKHISEMEKTPLITPLKYCENHMGKTVEVFCNDHDQPCCTMCVAIYHRKCDHVTALEDAASGVLKSKCFASLLKRLSETSELNQELVKEKRQNIKVLERQKRNIQQELQGIKQLIINHFDTLQSQFMQDFTRIHERRVKELTDAINEIENREKVIQNCTHLMESCKLETSETTVFLEMIKVLQREKEHVKILKKALNNHEYLEYLFKRDEDMEQKSRCFKGVGTLDVLKKASFSAKVYPTRLKDCIAKGISCISIEKKLGVRDDVHGGCFLSDSTLLLGLGNILVKLDGNGDVIQQNDILSKTMMDITIIDSTFVAILTQIQMNRRFDTIQNANIVFVDIQTLTVNRTLNVPNNGACFGIAYNDDKLYIGCYNVLLILDRDGNNINQIKTNGTLCGVTIIADKETRVVYINNNTHSCHFVRASDLQELHTFKHDDLKRPKHVTSDRESNVYIVGNATSDSESNAYIDRNAPNTVLFQLSFEGILLRILLDKLFSLSSIGFDDNSDRFFISFSDRADNMKEKVAFYEMMTEY